MFMYKILQCNRFKLIAALVMELSFVLPIFVGWLVDVTMFTVYFSIGCDLLCGRCRR